MKSKAATESHCIRHFSITTKVWTGFRAGPKRRISSDLFIYRHTYTYVRMYADIYIKTDRNWLLRNISCGQHGLHHLRASRPRFKSSAKTDQNQAKKSSREGSSTSEASLWLGTHRLTSSPGNMVEDDRAQSFMHNKCATGVRRNRF